jgi:hypothetical protein
LISEIETAHDRTIEMSAVVAAFSNETASDRPGAAHERLVDNGHARTDKEITHILKVILDCSAKAI